MDIQGEINALENKIAGLKTQLDTATGNKEIAIIYLITAKVNQLTEL